ncbi:Alpha/Beta hydrolase protein [Pholiota molesta]|nr:Alpha/Beta hydrolase protein [Pholiota molesta]
MASAALLRRAPRLCRPRLLARLSSSKCLPPGPASAQPPSASSSTPHFPCVDAHAARESRLLASKDHASAAASTDPSGSGPEPPYARPNPTSYHVYHHPRPLPLTYRPHDPLPSFDIAYETWGTLSPNKDNVILLHTGLSASSHAASTPLNPSPGWWEAFIGPGKALDTDHFFIICTNVLGGCYGSTGPSSIEPATGKPWATRFPILSIFDMVQAQFHLLDSLGVERLYASVGCSMGGMQSLAAGWLHPERVGKIVSISGTARSSPSAVAMRFAQRSVLMADPNWKNGFYYDGLPPHTGMKLARQIATITYRSGPEWDQRFGRQLRPLAASDTDPAAAAVPPALSLTHAGPDRAPALCPDFLIETYLDHQGEQFCLKYDANSLLYISKAMDLFDMTQPALSALSIKPSQPTATTTSSPAPAPSQNKTSHSKSHPPPVNPPAHLSALAQGMAPLRGIPTLVLGVQSDILFTVEQQREVADALRMGGNERVSYYELGGVWGHDTFLIDVLNVGGAIRGFLS